ncbi:MAG: hypothetical protein LBE13_04675 [Bacteroidales bacterium]|jgi:predicted component of type VI protein secretion system|nr:hypothetical protein [Bacteroidales bacterium]
MLYLILKVMENRHNKSIPSEVLRESQDLINRIISLLLPYILPLTPEERHALVKMGNKSVSFVEKAFDYARHYPEFCPSYFDLSAFEIDVNDAIGLRVLNISARQLVDNIEDTSMVAGSEAFQAALIFYNAVKSAAAQNIPGAKEAYNDLKTRFPRTKHKKENEAL